MHEFSLAQGLFEQLLRLADDHQAEKIVTVRVEIGRLSGIVIDSFSFGFEILARENKLTRNAVLEVTETPPQHNCLQCGEIYTSVVERKERCPRCGSSDSVLSGGDDLILTQVVME